MYETYMSGVRKFGISRDCMQRAKSKKKREAGWYGKYLWHIDLPSRRAAILIESAFATVSGECESTTVDYTWEGFDDLRRLLGGGSEFTRMSLDNFVATVTMLERQYAGIGRVGFAKKRVSDCIDYLQVAEVISSGIGFFASCDPGVLKSGIPRPLDVISEAPYGRQIDYYQTGPISADRKLDDWRGYVLDYSEVLSFYGIDPFVEPAWVSGEWWE
jgi:hypothetical protein